MTKNLWLLFMTKLVYKKLNLKNLGYYGRTVAYQVVSITDFNDLYNVYLYKIKDLGTKEIKTFVSASDSHFISFGKETVKLCEGFIFCVKNTNKKQGRGFAFEKYVLSK